MSAAIARVLSIAGTDPTGGAGIQADLKSIAAAGGFGMSVVTALVAQNTQGVRDIHTPPLSFLRAQLDAVADDVTIDAVKIGMLGSADLIEVIAQWLRETDPPLVVLDPVMIASSGDSLLAPDAIDALRGLIELVDVITPNVPELALLAGEPAAATFAEAIAQAQRFAAAHQVAVVAKSGHVEDAQAGNAYVWPDEKVHLATAARIDTPNTHGTGCSLSSALTTRLASGDSPEAAVTWTTQWLRESIEHASALQVGHGHGPIDHSHRARRLERLALDAKLSARTSGAVF